MAAREKSAELVRLVSAFERSEGLKELAKESVTFLREVGRANAENYHHKLCSAMLKVINGGGQEYADLLRYGGPAKTLVVIHSDIARVT